MYRSYLDCYENRRGLQYLRGEFAACKGKWDPNTKLYVNTTPDEKRECCQKICQLYSDRLPDCYQRCISRIPDTV